MREDSDTGDEALIERVLTAAGERPALPDDLKQRWEMLFGEAVRAARRERRRRVTVRWLPVAVGVAVVTILAIRFDDGPTEPEAFATVIASRGVSESERAAVRLGQVIPVGVHLRTGPNGYLSLEVGGAEVRLAPETTLLTARDRLDVDAGRVYVDTGPAALGETGPPRRGDTGPAAPGRTGPAAPGSTGPAALGETGPAAASHLAIDTPLGRVTHTGTQFLVAVAPRELTVAVREGTVQLSTDRAQRAVRAAPDAAALLVVTAEGSLDERRIAAHGGIWAWTEMAGRGFAVAGRAADDALRWAARQRGLRLVYVTPEARGRAAALLSAPADSVFGPTEVLSLVSRVTFLDVDTNTPGEVRVSERNDDSE